MNLTVKRQNFTAESTIGILQINGAFECYTLEDTVRPDGVKVKGKTAIPKGVYKVVLDFSNRFQRTLPHVLNVPNFEGIRIHPGNSAVDTEGCILVGKTPEHNYVTNSREAFIKLFDKLLKVSNSKEDIWLTIL